MELVKSSGRPRGRSIALLVAGLLTGTVLIQPAVAHVTRRLGHLQKHLDKRYVRTGTTVPNATNAANLGGSPASNYLQTTDIRVDGAVSDVYIPNFSSATFVPLLSKSFTAPSDGFLFIVGSVSWERSVDPATLQYRLRLDSTPVTSDEFAYMADAEAGENQETGSASAVVPVTAGAHTVHLDGRAFSGQPFIIGRDVSILFAKSGSGVTIPVRSPGRTTGSDMPSQT
jgi:hypothetical protein